MRKILLSMVLVSAWVLFLGVANAQQDKLLPTSDDVAEDPGVPGACAVPGNLIVNCGFETGTFMGWTAVDPTGFTGVTGGVYIHTGNFGAFSGPVGLLGSISQTIPTTPGSGYNFSFWVRNGNPIGGTPNQWRAIWDGVTLLDRTDAPDFGYTRFEYCAEAVGTTTQVRFEFRQDPSFFGLDDVVVLGG